MLSRRNTVGSPNNPTGRKGNRLRRPKSISVFPIPTRAEMLAPQEQSQQAIQAAQRAYRDDLERRNIYVDQRKRQPINHIEQPRRSLQIDGRGQILQRQPSIRFHEPLDNRYEQENEGSRVHDSHGTEGYWLTEDSSSANHSGRTGGIQQNTNGSQQFTAQGRRAMNYTDPEAEALFAATIDAARAKVYYAPSFTDSNPSSYRKLRKAKSGYSVSQTLNQPRHERPPVQYFSALPPESCGEFSGDGVPRGRKSMSFLRGGTEFMPQSLREQQQRYSEEAPVLRERKSFYLSASSRRGQLPISFPETVRGQKNASQEKHGSMRKTVAKARKMLGNSFLRPVKRAFGIHKEDHGGIPEQHVASTRPHFRDYVPASELHEDISDIPVPRVYDFRVPSTVLSRAPLLHRARSSETLHSMSGSIRSVTPPNATLRNISLATTGTWNSTLASNSSARKRLSIIDENSPHKVRESIYAPPSSSNQKPVIGGVDARRLYSALMRRLDENSPRAKREQHEYVHGTGYYMPAGIGLLEEEAGIFGRSPTAMSNQTITTTIRKPTKSQDNQVHSEGEVSGSLPPKTPVKVMERPEKYAQRKQVPGMAAGESQANIQEKEIKEKALQVESSPGPTLSLFPRSPRQRTTDNRPATADSTTANSLITPQKKTLRPSRSAFFPYSVEAVSRDSTPSPYKRAKGAIPPEEVPVCSLNSSIAPANKTPTPQESASTPTLTQAPADETSIFLNNKSRNGDDSSTPSGGKINPGLYNSRSSVALRNTNTNTGAKFRIRGGLKMRDPNTLGVDNGNGRPGPGLHRSRSVLTASNVDIRKAVDSQFGPVQGFDRNRENGRIRMVKPDTPVAWAGSERSDSAGVAFI